MAQLGGTLRSAPGAGGLPAPKVQTYMPVIRPDVFVSDNQPSAGNPMQVIPSVYVKVTVPGIPQNILDDIAGYQPMVELMRFARKGSLDNSASGNGFKSGAYVHPAHGPGASGNGSFTHGGSHGGVNTPIADIRPTEWAILNGNDAIDVTQGMLGFMCFLPVLYRDGSGANVFVDAVIPSSQSLARRARVSGRRFPYSAAFYPGYYQFRLSIIDQSDPRGKRIHGPVSDRIAVSTTKFPFNPAGLDAGGRAQAEIAPGYDPKAVSFWLGAPSRLP